MQELHGLPFWMIWSGMIGLALILGVGIGYLLRGPDKWTPKSKKGGFGT